MLKLLLAILVTFSGVAHGALGEKSAPIILKKESATYSVTDQLSSNQQPYTEVWDRIGDEIYIRVGGGIIGIATETVDGKESQLKPTGFLFISKTIFKRPVFLLGDGEETTGQFQKVNRLNNEVVGVDDIEVRVEKISPELTKYTYKRESGNTLLVKVVVYRAGSRLPIEITKLKFIGDSTTPSLHLQFLRN